VIHPTHYVFREETETCTPVYSEYSEDYKTFYKNVLNDIEKAKASNKPAVYDESHPNWFDASYLPWVSYDSLHMELPDGYLYFPPVVYWGKYREEIGKILLPVTAMLHHAVCDGFNISRFFEELSQEVKNFKI
jgi:chloramphenicol O-acetyltransferase type A